MNTGIGVMINELFGDGNKRAEAVRKSLKKTIAQIEIIDDHLFVSFKDSTKLVLWDGGQSCCESRYMLTDDDVSYHIGAKLLAIELRDAPSIEGGYGDHEVKFLVLKTNRGEIVFSNHNEHNGYYGGFGIDAWVEEGSNKERSKHD